MFLLIFGPVVDVGLGQLGDVSFLLSITIIVYALLFKRIKVPVYMRYALGLVVSIFILALLNTILLDPFEILVGIRAIFRPVRVFVVVLSCYYCVVFVDGWLGQIKVSHQDRFIALVQLVYLIVVIHATLMCLQFVFPDFRDFIYQFTFAKNQLEYNKMFRMAGLTGAGGAQTSFVQGLGCLLGWFLIFYKDYSHKTLVVIGNVLIIFSIILSGRTGLLVVALGFLLFLFLNVIISLSVKKKRLSFNPFYILLLVPLVLIINSIPALLGENLVYFETAFNRTFKTLIDFSETGSFQDDTVAALADMIIMPGEISHLLIGRSSYLEGNTYYNVMTDIGYFRLVWGYGVIGLILHVLFYLVFIIKLVRMKYKDLNDFYLWFLPLSIISFVFLMNAKEIFFMTRISLHITLVVVLYYIYVKSPHRNQLT